MDLSIFNLPIMNTVDVAQSIIPPMEFKITITPTKILRTLIAKILLITLT